MTKRPYWEQADNAFDEELDELLDHEIEARIKAAIWSQEKCKYAQRFLDQRALARAKAVHVEQTNIARSSKNAAWVAATFAIVSAIAAIIAATVAVIALFNSWGPS